MKKVLSIAFIFILSLGLILVRPFDIYADERVTISLSNVRGCAIVSVEETINNDYSYGVECYLDNYYYGRVLANFTLTRSDNTSWTTQSDLILIGNVARGVVRSGNVSMRFNDLISITNISTIEAYKYDNNDGNNFWTFPIESYLPIQTLFNNGFILDGLSKFNYYSYPIFKEDSSKVITNTTSSLINNEYQKIILIMYSTRYIYNINQFNSYFSYNSGFEVSNYQWLNRSVSGYFFRVDFTNISNSEISLNLKSKYSTGKFFVIYNLPYVDGYVFNVSTEFALQYGLNNSFLNNIEIIAQGTQLSNDSSSDLEDSANDISDINAPVFTLEDNFNDDLNDALDDIDTTFTFENGFGSKFLSSANFVKNEFDFITQNTAFGSLLSFSLLLGLGLLIIGKIL